MQMRGMLAVCLLVACSRSTTPGSASQSPTSQPPTAAQDEPKDPARLSARERDRKQSLELPRFESTQLVARGVSGHASLGELALFDLDAKPVQFNGDPTRLSLVVLSSLSCPVSRDNSKRLTSTANAMAARRSHSPRRTGKPRR